MTSTQAVVLGAGLAGLAAARVLADHFDEVVLLERDTIDLEQQARWPCNCHTKHCQLAGTPRCLCRYVYALAGWLEEAMPRVSRKQVSVC